MVNVALLMLSGLGFACLLIGVHEYGHLLCGRLLGVPAHGIRVELSARPPHTALRDGREWLGPDHPEYAAVFQAHQTRIAGAWLFVAGGLLTETVVAVIGVAALSAAGWDPVAVVLAWTTAALFAVYLLADVVLTRRVGPPYGDQSALWRISPPATALLVLGVATVKTATLVLVSL